MASPEPAADRVAEIQAEWRRERPDLDVAPQGVIGRVHRLAAHLTAELVEVYARYGLGEGEFDVLATLRRSGGAFELAPSELAGHTMVTTGAMTKRLDRLEAAGFVVRRAAGGDGRRRVVALTASGVALIDEAFAAHMANEARLLAGLPAADRAALERILSHWLHELGL
ncbi:MarR family transcriptional regulator [Herbiconiux sp. VKM Ac-1786]|uniref:MarR family winged helix-turn-helix transcriptional regulator n=1 Tax=Herbiconiux sp. VKM Ac-1786 TaxID=2783824 RepID=UPI001889F156|nr:MarR family transcriptional regulator [Herbiconiux sp. VKM Ac-1786]MBF4572828.1 MarR family transcriptional regulator [Herbiconiux sp. VKM Ac-1786]